MWLKSGFENVTFKINPPLQPPMSPPMLQLNLHYVEKFLKRGKNRFQIRMCKVLIDMTGWKKWRLVKMTLP